MVGWWWWTVDIKTSDNIPLDVQIAAIRAWKNLKRLLEMIQFRNAPWKIESVSESWTGKVIKLSGAMRLHMHVRLFVQTSH